VGKRVRRGMKVKAGVDPREVAGRRNASASPQPSADADPAVGKRSSKSSQVETRKMRELCLGRVKAEETLVEARDRFDVQINEQITGIGAKD